MLTLPQYVNARNGVPLGHKDSLKNMLYRALGAKSFALFWCYWNPIWGYYLGRYINKPLVHLLPKSFALIVTFMVSGALHDIAVSLVKQDVILFFTPWFTLMGSLVVFTTKFHISSSNQPWLTRAAMNCTFILVSLFIMQLLFN